MGLFFGTDGLRGKVNEDLTPEVAYKVGNALSILKEKPVILIGGDTRISRTYLTSGLASGAPAGVAADVREAGRQLCHGDSACGRKENLFCEK